MKQALLIIDHGSRFDDANQMLEGVASLCRQSRPNLIVEIAHMELASPTIEEGFIACVEKGANHITAHPYMLSPGRHATQDIPQLVNEVASRYPDIQLSITDPLGIHPKLGELILERANL